MLSDGQRVSPIRGAAGEWTELFLRQFQARFGVVGPAEIDSVMRSRQLAKASKKRRARALPGQEGARLRTDLPVVRVLKKCR